MASGHVVIVACPPYGVYPSTYAVFDGHAIAGHLGQYLIFIKFTTSTTLLYIMVLVIVNSWSKFLQNREE